MSKFDYRVLIGSQLIEILGKTSASKDRSDVYRAARLYGNVVVLVGTIDPQLIVSYKKLKELDTKFFTGSHDNDVIIETVKSAFKVILARKNAEGFDVGLASRRDDYSEFCTLL